MTAKKPKIAIVGATGNVGREVLDIIDDREIKVIDTFFDENISNYNDQTQTVVLSQVLEHAYYPFEFLNNL